jgi:ketosteroid isomerase-like protein
MKKVLLVIFCFALFVGCKKEEVKEEMKEQVKKETKEGTSVLTTAALKVQDVEFADNKYAERGKKALNDLTRGDMDAWMAQFADNAKYYWNSGDSLVGKPAIDKYWRNRRANVFETITFENEIWLPVKVNKSENIKNPGNFLLGWYKITVKYKGGKSMTQGIHTVFHFDENDKIDVVNQYLDRAVITEAMKK